MGAKIPPPTAANTLTLKTLDAASQASRLQFAKDTRGPKADRLQLVGKIAPLSDEATWNWSATGIAFADGNAYVSWHSNHQAHTPATRWGGAIDQINIDQFKNATNTALTQTKMLETAKLNNVIADGTTLYFPMTDYKNGAVVGRLAAGAEGIDTIAVPGSSVNTVSVVNGTIYAASGYQGAAYTVNFAAPEGEKKFAMLGSYSENFGGKYIDGTMLLRTDDSKAYIRDLVAGTERELSAPLTSEEKFAEIYDPSEGDWSQVQGEKATHYGKHTMAIADGYTYVAGGKGKDGVNGLRVYGATGAAPVWQNGTNTTAVCVHGEYVYAATGAGLRVYKKYEEAPAQGDNFKLFAYEVKEYNNGMAVGHEAGTTGHSGNFVAVDPTSGLIFVAYGQSGVYVFRLDPTIPDQPELPESVKVTVTIPENPNWTEDKDVKPGENAEFDLPQPENVPDDKEFLGWTTDPDDPDAPVYQPGENQIPAGNEDTTVTLYPKYKNKYEVKFDVNGGSGSVPTQYVKQGESITLPTEGVTPPADKDFLGWATTTDATEPLAGPYTPTANVTLYAVYKDHAYAYTVKFKYFRDNDVDEGVSGLPADLVSDTNEFTLPGANNDAPKWGERQFHGWATDPEHYDYESDVLKPGSKFSIPENASVITLYGVWSSKIEGGGGEDQEQPDEPVAGGEESNDKG